MTGTPRNHVLTVKIQWCWVTHIYVAKQGHHWFRYRSVACSALNRHLKQWWLIINWTLGNIPVKIESKCNTFIEGNQVENILCRLAAILSRVKCLNLTGLMTPHVEHYPSKYQSFIYNTWYLIRSLIVRYRKGSKPWMLCLQLSDRFENWQVLRRLCCRDAWQI